MKYKVKRTDMEGIYDYRGYRISRHDDTPTGYWGRYRANWKKHFTYLSECKEYIDSMAEEKKEKDILESIERERVRCEIKAKDYKEFISEVSVKLRKIKKRKKEIDKRWEESFDNNLRFEKKKNKS